MPNNRTASLCALMQSLMSPARGFKYDKKPEETQLALGRVFVFAYVWALGGNLQHGVREEFDEFAREILANAANFPGEGPRLGAGPVHAACRNR